MRYGFRLDEYTPRYIAALGSGSALKGFSALPEFFLWWCGQDGRYVLNASLDRIREIADLIGEELAIAAIDEATEEFGESLDPRVWNLFNNGSSLPPAVAKKWNTGKAETQEDWEASCKLPDASKEVAKEPGRRRRVPAPK